jgi:Na+-transporting methylmalonyl-CoA/oxaloacetate decarboxylase gamma subunit
MSVIVCTYLCYCYRYQISLLLLVLVFMLLLLLLLLLPFVVGDFVISTTATATTSTPTVAHANRDVAVATSSSTAVLAAAAAAAAAKELCHRMQAGPRKEREQDWQDSHKAFYKDNKLRWGAAMPAQEDRDSPWWRDVMERERDIIAAVPKVKPGIMLCNVSQAIGRVPVNSQMTIQKSPNLLPTTLEIAPTNLPKDRIWNLRLQRFHIGDEALLMQGFPIADYADLLARHTDKLKLDLAGNMFAGPCVLAMFGAVLLTAPWAKDAVMCGETSSSSSSSSWIASESDVAMALSFLKGV